MNLDEARFGALYLRDSRIDRENDVHVVRRGDEVFREVSELPEAVQALVTRALTL